MPDKYFCVHGVNETILTSECDEVLCSIRAMVPVSGYREIWTVQLKNLSQEEQELSSFTVIGFEDGGAMGGICTYDEEQEILYRYSFPYHVYYEDKEKVEHNYSCYYMFSDVSPISWEMSQRRFWGSDDMGEYPVALKRETCSKLVAEAEKFCGCLQHKFVIAPGETVEYHIQVGAARSIDEVKDHKLAWNDTYVEENEAQIRDYWDNICGSFYIQSPDENVNFFTNYWLKKQITILTRLNRGGVYCPVRNQLQDALGYSLVQSKEAKKYVYQVLRLQKQNGYIKQWYMTDGSPERDLCLLKHSDGPLWLIIAAIIMINQNGDNQLYEDIIPYADGGAGTVYEHLLKAVTYMYEARGEHGLCLIGDGDWNDPINGLGRLGKGESTWSTMALIYGINLMLEHMVDSSDIHKYLKNIRDKLIDKVHAYCWIKDRYIVGYDDEGIPAGDEADNDRLFLNTQTWAIIAGVATKEQMPIILKNLERLETKLGPLLLDPPFDAWDKRWGRISIKKSGTTENGSVYNHASMFKAYADAIRKDGAAAYRTICKTLPTNPDNPPEKNLQLPIYISNYYYALKDSPNYGRSSCHYGTGTVAWLLFVIKEEIFGIKSTTKGLHISPNLPKDWKNVSCVCKFKDATYHVSISQGNHSMKVNGEVYNKRFLPYEPDKTYWVEVGFTK